MTKPLVIGVVAAVVAVALLVTTAMIWRSGRSSTTTSQTGSSWLSEDRLPSTTNPNALKPPSAVKKWWGKATGAVGGAVAGAKTWAGTTALPTGAFDWLLVIAFFGGLVAIRKLMKRGEMGIALILLAVIIMGIIVKAGGSFAPSITMTAPKAWALVLVGLQCLALGFEKEKRLDALSFLAAGGGLVWTLITRGGTMFPFYPWWLAWVTWVWSVSPGIFGSSLDKGAKWIIVILGSALLLWIA